MNIFTVFKSIFFVLLIYFSFILNNSLSSVFTSNLMLTAILLGLILSDLASFLYRFVFSNSPGILFYLAMFFATCFVALNNLFLSEYFIIFFALFFYNYFTLFLSRFSVIDDQLIAESSSYDTITKNYVLHEKKGILFVSYTLNYANDLAFMSTADKHNFYDLIKNNNGYILYNDDVSINFTLHKLGLRFIGSVKENLIRAIEDIDSMLLNLLIEK